MPSPFTLRATGTTTGGGEIDAAEVRRALTLLADPTAAVQVQQLCWGRVGEDGKRRPCSGPWEHARGDDIDGMMRAAQTCAGGFGTYLTLNPFPAGLGRVVRNGDITGRRWLMLDADPVREKNANSTNGEHEAAGELVVKIARELSEEGWPQPIGIDSGNGRHLIYRVDLSNDGMARSLVRDVVRWAADRFDTDGVKIDRGVFSAKQQTKLPGTWARKGQPSKERPHRRVRLMYVPGSVAPVPLDLLERTANEYRAAQGKKPLPERPTVSPFRLVANDPRTRAYAKAAIRNEAMLVQLAPPGTSNNTLRDAAFKLGTLDGVYAMFRQEAKAELRLAAHQRNVPDREAEDVVDRAYQAGSENLRLIPLATSGVQPSANGVHTTAKPSEDDGKWTVLIGGEVVAEGTPEYFSALGGAQVNGPRQRVFEVVTMADLMLTEFPDPNWAVAGLLAEGLNLLAGAPKMGKSMMALNLALTVAAGGKALGNIQTVPGDVLYLSLEDRLRRVKARAAKMLRGIGGEAPRRLSIVTEWPRVHQGGLKLLGEWVKRVERPTLVIIDVLGKFRPPTRDRGNAYEQDSEHLYAIKNFADEHATTALVLHHTRKAPSEDPVENVSGTMGVTGACDGILVLKRARSSNEAVVTVTGRDAPEQELAVEFNPETLTWRSLGSAEEHVGGKLQKAVIAYLKKLNGMAAFTTDIAAHLTESPDKIRPVLHRLFDRLIVRKVGNAWAFPGEGGEDGAEVIEA